MNIKGRLCLFAMPSYHAQLVGFTRERQNWCCDVRFLPGRLSMLSSHDFLTDNASSAMKINILFFTSSLYLHFFIYKKHYEGHYDVTRFFVGNVLDSSGHSK